MLQTTNNNEGEWRQIGLSQALQQNPSVFFHTQRVIVKVKSHRASLYRSIEILGG